MAVALTIRDEGDAFSALRLLLQGKLEQVDSLVFDGWPKLQMDLNGPKFRQSVTPTVMTELIDLQRAIYRGFALARYNNPDIKSLSTDEKTRLEMVVTVGPGSSFLEPDNIVEIIKEFIKGVGDKMEPKHWICIVLIFTLGYFGNTAYEHYLESQKEVKLQQAKNDEQKQLIQGMLDASKANNENVKLLIEASKTSQQAANVYATSHDANDAKTRVARRSLHAKINGVTLTGEQAAALVANPRQQAVEIRMDGKYRVLKVDNTDPLSYKVSIWSPDTRQTITAQLQNETVTGEARNVLSRAVTERMPVVLQVNAREIRGEIRDATVVKVEELRQLADE
ncbi:hypothetical protein [Burkholderia pseudomallei]|uniref:hypothetical protein n=1 Tax=Burkholderia pseudomallei TaxID=28450 RepID=UPI0011C4B1AE|nr:hypothetical protein [Burkholderia pseudomallei]MCW0024624.1 hypothetical protein [Burkholderia pseudomallei]MCW0156073.1 hypothetical protein [Burkholderia pseudomallei]MCW0169499.1 hypothetical protein [Burkholderia pseudomallei]